MITEKQLRAVDELRSKKDKVDSLLRSFTSKHVWSRVGIVDINGATTKDPKPSEYARFFHNEMKPLVDELSEKVITHLEHEKRAIDLELSKYISAD